MATRVSENPEVQQQYTTQAGLTAALVAALRALWPQVDPLSGPAALNKYTDGVAALVEQFSQASISLAADYYDAVRAQAGITGTFRTPIIDTPPRSLVDAGVEWAMRAQADMAAIQSRIEAAAQKAVADSARDEVVTAVEGDDKALGFARVARPDACYFCLAQAMRRKKPTASDPSERPGVYKSRGTAGGFVNHKFTGSGAAKFHNDCHCVVEPVFSTGYQLAPHIADAERLYFESTLHSEKGQSLNDFRRALAATRAGKPIPVLPSKVRPIKPISPADALAELFSRLPKPAA